MTLADFTDATELLHGGVFVLLDRGEVVFVGRASGPMLPRIAALRASERPKFNETSPATAPLRIEPLCVFEKRI
jgi:hypothetical protein